MVLSSEIKKMGTLTLLGEGEGRADRRAIASVVSVLRSLQTRRMCGCVLCGTREIPPVSKGRLLAAKGARHDAVGKADGKSDEVSVVKKPANKIRGLMAERVERRTSAERSLTRSNFPIRLRISRPVHS